MNRDVGSLAMGLAAAWLAAGMGAGCARRTLVAGSLGSPDARTADAAGDGEVGADPTIPGLDAGDASEPQDNGKDAESDGGGQARGPRLELLAGGLGGLGNVDGIGAAARFHTPVGVASDGAGSLFVSDAIACQIRKVVIATGEVTTLAGSSAHQGYRDGTGAAASFGNPIGVTGDGAGNLLVADGGTIRKVVMATGEVTTLAGSAGQAGSNDGRGAAARFSQLWGVASDGAGNLFVTDNAMIRKVVIATGEVTTLAGSPGQRGSNDGTGAAARFEVPAGLASDGAGNLFVADYGNATLRRVVVATGEVVTFAGSAGQSGNDDGTGVAARFYRPRDVASDGTGNLFVADSGMIRRVVIATGEVTTLAGSLGPPESRDGTGAAARFYGPAAVASDGAGNLLVADAYTQGGPLNGATIRKVVVATGEVTTLAGASEQTGTSDGAGAGARFDFPFGMASDEAGNLFVADYGNDTIRKVVIATGEVTTFAGSPGRPGSADGTKADARFSAPQGLASDGAGNLFVGDSGNHTIRKVVVATGEVTTLAGSPGQMGSSDGTGAAARFYLPTGVASDGAGNLFVGDLSNHTIRKVVVATGEVTTLAGSPGETGGADGTGAKARFYGPGLLASDRAGHLFLGENNTIRKVVIATGEVTTLAGSPGISGSADGAGSAALFSSIDGVVSDGVDTLFVADTGNRTIRKIAVSTQTVTTVVGSAGHLGVVVGPLPAGLNDPRGLALGPTGELFISDSAENAILVARF